MSTNEGIKGSLGAIRSKDVFTRVRIPIRTKIILPYLILCLILALGAAYLITQIVFDSLEERFTNQLIESGKLASEMMFNEEERLLASLRLISNAEGVSEAIQQREAEKLRELTFGILVDNQEEAVEILDSRGYMLLSMHHRKGGNIEEYEFSKDGDNGLLKWEFVNKVVHQQSDVFSNKYSGLVQTGGDDYFYIAGPILDPAGSQVGTILVGRSLPELAQQIREESLGQVTFYSFAGDIYESTFNLPEKIDDGSVATVLENQDTSSLSRNLRDIQISNIDYQEIIGPWEVRDNTDIGLIGVALPKSFYVSPNRITRLQIILLVGTAFFLVILMGVNLARIITQPLISLVHASSQVSHGDLQVKVEPKSNDEVAVLTEAFNTMVSSLQSSRSALLHAYDSTLEGWSKALELRDKETEGHTLRVTKMTVDIARAMGINNEDLIHIQRGALLHDIGKMGIPDQILLKPGKLTGGEWEVMRKHPEYAYEMLWPIEYLRPSLDIPYYHHEHWDGTGYPKGLKGEEIPIAARIFAAVDVWDALLSDRPYKKAMSRLAAIAEIKSESGSHFDPQVVEFLLQYLSENDQEPMNEQPSP